jgi:crotonobetainyl-CoA:carnitine CoA-transferase CaiB-like acyl-CoA transferase
LQIFHQKGEKLQGPLSHIKVIDLSRVMAGPSAGQILADLGADVIKVERPVVGDDSRGWGPPFLKDKNGADTGESGYFLSVNRGKRSITIDLSKPEGQKIIRMLASSFDVLLENYKVGTLKRYGLSYDDLKKINPELIYCSITGFGQTGPRSDQAAYDFMIQAMGGLMSITGERDDKPGGGPQKIGIPIVDLVAGFYAVIGILAALAKRDVSKGGEYIDIAMLDAEAAMLTNQAMNFLIGGIVPKRNGNAHPNIQPQDIFSCHDGDIVLAVGNDLQFGKLCDVLGFSEMAGDQRFARMESRLRNISILRPLIADKFKQQDRGYWLEKLDAAGIPAGPINNIPEAFNDPQIKHRGTIIDIPHPLAGKMPIIANPLRFSEKPMKHEIPPPLLGEHTVEILHNLGLKDEEIRSLKENGVI